MIDPTAAIELLRALVAGERHAMRSFLEAYGGLLRYWVRGAVAFGRLPPDASEDLFQEVIMALTHSNCARMQAWNGRGSFEGFLKVVVRNFVSNHIRDNSRFERLDRVEASNDDQWQGQSEVIPQKSASQALEEHETLLRRKQLLLAKLSPSEVVCYRLLFEEELSPEQAAEALGMTANNVFQKRHQIKQKLLEVLEGE